MVVCTRRNHLRAGAWYNGIAMVKNIPIDNNALVALCKRHRITRLAFFGSVVHDDFRPDSDVDTLVEFDPMARVGLFDVARVQIELGELLGARSTPQYTGQPEQVFSRRRAPGSRGPVCRGMTRSFASGMLNHAMEAVELLGDKPKDELKFNTTTTPSE